MRKLFFSLITFFIINGFAALSKPMANTTPLVLGEALSFDGLDDYVVTTGFSSFSEYTIEAWVKLNTTVDQNIILATDNTGPLTSFSHNLRLVGGKFTHYTWDGNSRFLTSPVVVTIGTWYHVAISAKNNGKMKIVVNNTETISSFNIGVSWASLNQFRLGGKALGLNNFNGQLDEVRIWNSQLCLPEIANNMNGEIVGSSNNLIVNYHFNQGIGGGNNAGVISLLDDSGFNKTGVLTNFTLMTNVSNWVTPGAIVSGSIVVPLTKHTISIDSPSLICSATQYSLTASGSNNYLWSTGLTTASLVLFEIVSSPTTYSYSVTGYDTNACASNPASITFTVYPSPTIAVYDGYACAGTNYTVNPTGGINYTYSTGSNVINALTNTTFTVIGSNSYGCVDSASATVFFQNCGQSGSSLCFDGNNDEVNTNVAYNNIGTTWTFECWAKGASAPSRNNGYSGPMYGANRCIVWHHPDTVFMAGASVRDASYNYFAASYGVLLPETWYHLAATYDGNVLRAYKNGLLTDSVSTGGGVSSAFGNLAFGRHPTLNNFWDGTMDEARVWTVARTCAEINQFMNTELTGNELGLLAYYNFNEGIPTGNNIGVTSLMDNTANSLNANINNFALTGNTSNFFLGAPFDATYNCGAVNIDETIKSTDEFNVYPIPTSSELNIISDVKIKLSIFNIIGEEIYTKIIDGSETIDVSELSSGVYFVVNTQTGRAIKFVKE